MLVLNSNHCLDMSDCLVGVIWHRSHLHR